MVFGNLKGIHIKINQEVVMQEQQGSLTPPLSGLPGPRPFKRRKTKMEDNKTTSSNPTQADGKPDMGKPVTANVDEIVAKTAEAIGAGKAFGGWTDDVEEQAKISKLTIPVKLGKGQPAYKEKVSRDDAKAAADMFDSLRSKKKPVKESNISKQMSRVKALAMKQAKKAAKDAPLVKIGPDSSRPTHKQQYTKNIRPSDLQKEAVLKTVGKVALNIGKDAAKDAAKQRATDLAYSGIKKVTSRRKPVEKEPQGTVPTNTQVQHTDRPSNPVSKPLQQESVQQLNELPILPALAPLAKMAGGALLKKGIVGGMARNVAGSALGKMFKKSKNPGEEGKE